MASGGLLGIPPNWFIILALAAIPLMIFFLLVFCIAVVVLPVLGILLAIPAVVFYMLSSRRRERIRRGSAGSAIDVEYRVLSGNDREGPKPG